MSQTKPEMLSRIKIEGFKSIAACDLELGPLNVMIGPNGAGKSNFLSFFTLMRAMAKEQLQLYVAKQGGPDAMLRFGRKRTPQLKAFYKIQDFCHSFALAVNPENRFIFENEEYETDLFGPNQCFGHSDLESAIFESSSPLDAFFREDLEEEAFHNQENDQSPPINYGIDPQTFRSHVRNWVTYHFLDTGDDSPIKQMHGINDNLLLKPNGANLAAFLYMLKVKHKAEYQDIVETIELVAPFFDDFVLRPNIHNQDVIELEWIEKGEETPLKAYTLSDGTLRFICLVTALLQPDEYLPKLILIDEPELGLHPYAITLLAALIKNASLRAQVILSTQSVNLLNEFEPDQVIVADRLESATVLKRLSEEDLAIWLEDYSLGELWEKNILGGRPSW